MCWQCEQEQDELALPAFAPVSLPGAADLLRDAEASRVVRELREFVLGLGEGQPPSTTLIAHWATACGLVRTVKGAQVPVKKNAKLLKQPLELWERAFREFDALAFDIASEDEATPSMFALYFPDLMAMIRMTLYGAPGTPVPLELLHHGIAEGLSTEVVSAEELAGERARWRDALIGALGTLARLGAVDTTRSADQAELAKITELFGSATPVPTLVSLTPLGFWAMNRLLRESGLDAPVMGELANGDLGTLCAHLALATGSAVESELTAWVAHRSAADAATEAAEFLMTTESPLERLFALTAMAETGEPGLTAAKGVRAAGGIAGSVTAAWLIERGVLDAGSLTREEATVGMTDHYAALHLLGDLLPELCEHPVDEQLAFIAVLAETDHPAGPELLDVIGREHPDNKVAKPARKASFKLRSDGR